MPAERPPITPLKADVTLNYLDTRQLDKLQSATLTLLEEVGVRFPSEPALQIFTDHGAEVDHDSQIVKLSPTLVRKALSTVPRYFTLGARNPKFDLHLEENVSYFTTDGCGYETIDLVTGLRRPSSKADVG
jgi:trimethylamine--corrinoid protein Co-methyltransferase